jgi:anti-sigma regulatory factor (Ser/Thr protein kinase)
LRFDGCGKGTPLPVTDTSTADVLPLRLIVPAVPEVVPHVRHQIRRHLQRFGIEAVGAVEAAVAEAVGNAVLHAYRDDPGDGEVEVLVSVEPDSVEVVVRDDGVGPLPHPEHPGAGYGVKLMKSLADRFEFDGSVGAGTTVRLGFTRPLS